jgi:aryl-alcohol dehydrogenase-like predicted oxidoreductase
MAIGDGNTITLAGRPVHRVGFGAMQLPGRGVFGPPDDRSEALAILRRAIDAGVDHIDTAQFYGPDVSNELIHEALHPYPEHLVLVSKVGAARDERGNWLEAQTPDALRAGVEANLRSLELDQIPVVNLRRHPETTVPYDEQIDAMKSFRDEGLIGAVGLSNVTLDQYLAARSTTDIACVQNMYNLADRGEHALFDFCRGDAVPFVPFFPLGSAFFPENPVLNAAATRNVAGRLHATPAQVALAWILAQAPTVLLIPGTSTIAHLEENLAAGELVLDEEALGELETVGSA